MNPKSGNMDKAYKSLDLYDYYDYLKDLQPEKITKLHLDNKKIKSLPENFGKFVNLFSLSLKGNHLASLPESFGTIPCS